MKRVLALLLCCVVVFLFAACGGTQTQTNDQSSTIAAYRDAAQKLLDNGDTEGALAALEEGIGVTNSPELIEMRDTILATVTEPETSAPEITEPEQTEPEKPAMDLTVYNGRWGANDMPNDLTMNMEFFCTGKDVFVTVRCVSYRALVACLSMQVPVSTLEGNQLELPFEYYGDTGKVCLTLNPHTIEYEVTEFLTDASDSSIVVEFGSAVFNYTGPIDTTVTVVYILEVDGYVVYTPYPDVPGSYLSSEEAVKETWGYYQLVDLRENASEEQDETEGLEGNWAGLTQVIQRRINLFLSNFTEAGFDEMPTDAYYMVNFAFMHTVINNSSDVDFEKEYAYLSESDVNRVLDQYFGTTIPHSDTPITYADPLSSYNKIEYSNSRYAFRADLGLGGGMNWIAVASDMQRNGDGTYEVEFDVYSVYGQAASEYYHVSAEEARNNGYLTLERSGHATVRDYTRPDGTQSYQLIRINY